MTEQLALTLIATTVGFLAAIFFCVGNAFNSAKQIALQASPFYDFNPHLARSITAQRVQYVVGALLLVASFGFQISAALASPTIPASLPQFLQFWHYFLLAVFFPSLTVSAFLAWLLYKSTMRKVLKLAQLTE